MSWNILQHWPLCSHRFSNQSASSVLEFDYSGSQLRGVRVATRAVLLQAWRRKFPHMPTLLFRTCRAYRPPFTGAAHTPTMQHRTVLHQTICPHVVRLCVHGVCKLYASCMYSYACCIHVARKLYVLQCSYFVHGLPTCTILDLAFSR